MCNDMIRPSDNVPDGRVGAAQGGEAGHEFQRLEQHMRGAVAERVFEFMDHQTIAIDTQALQGNCPLDT